MFMITAQKAGVFIWGEKVFKRFPGSFVLEYL